MNVTSWFILPDNPWECPMVHSLDTHLMTQRPCHDPRLHRGDVGAVPLKFSECQIIPPQTNPRTPKRMYNQCAGVLIETYFKPSTFNINI